MTDNPDERTYKVAMLARVEGEGRFSLTVRDGAVTGARLEIFEAPRFFEALLRGRSLEDVPDIVARICGICPVAYQMSSVRALENILGIVPSPAIRSLRRLLYCGEWIESHVLHIFMLHAPDFLGYPSAIEMAADHRDLVERGLRMKRTGNALVEVLGGRAVHPVSPCVGGFTRAPTRVELAALVPALALALEEAEQTVQWATGLPVPPFDGEPRVCVSLVSSTYPLEWGDELAITGRDPVPVEAFEEHFIEHHVEHSTALQCRLRDGTPYLTGPIARLDHGHDRLHPRAQRALERSGLALPVRNPHRSIVVRAIEVVHAFAEALDLIEVYTRPAQSRVPIHARAGEGCGATEAPRGVCWHRYRTADDGTILDAKIVPPTSQNQAQIERDLVALALEILRLDHAGATLLCERLIRAYDPCISCATHFLRLEVEELR